MNEELLQKIKELEKKNEELRGVIEEDLKSGWPDPTKGWEITPPYSLVKDQMTKEEYYKKIYKKPAAMAKIDVEIDMIRREQMKQIEKYVKEKEQA